MDEQEFFPITAHKLLRLHGAGLKPGKTIVVEVGPDERQGETEITKAPRGKATASGTYQDLARYFVKCLDGVATITRIK